MKRYILAIDQGTTSTRALVFDDTGAVLALAQRTLDLHTPQNGWVEQNPESIWQDTLSVCKDVIEKVGIENIACIGITNQRETTIVWDKQTGVPVYNAIVWQDRRTADFCKTLDANTITQKTGLLPDPYFSGTKLRWILENTPKNKNLIFGTIDTFLLWHLTQGRVHATDAGNAARTLMFNIHTQAWDDDLLEVLGVPKDMLPHVHDNGHEFGVTTLFGKPLPILAMMGDQQAALFGQACFESGMVKCTYGTGCFALMNAGAIAPQSRNRLLTTVAWRMNNVVTYAVEGSIFVAGAAIQFLRDNLGLIKTSSESEALALSVPDSNGVVFVPALTGLGAPHWVPEARGAIFGLTRGTTPAHIVRATLEAQAFQTRDLMTAMQADTGNRLKTLRVDGGLARNDLMCAMVANQLGCMVERPVNTESTAWGVAAMAGLQAGVFSGINQLTSLWQENARFTPQNTAKIDADYARWQDAVHRVIP